MDQPLDASINEQAQRPGKPRRRRRLWIIVVVVPLLLLAADTLYWRIAESHLADGLAAWLAARRAEGWVAVTAAPVQGGWPLAATLVVPNVSLTGGADDIPQGLAWTAERLTLRYALLRPGEMTVTAEGTQRLRVADGPSISYVAQQMQLVLPLQSGTPSFVELSADGVHARVPGDKDFSLGALRLHVDLRPDAPAGEPAMAFALQADAVSPPPFERVLGPRIASLTADGALDGPVSQAGTPSARAMAWREAGGSLAIRHLALEWGPLDLSGSATLALDEHLQPTGAGSARAVGYADTIDALAAHGLITRSAATATKAVLALLAHNPADGGPPDVEVPLTLQFRTLSMRQLPLMRLPELDWR